MLRLVLVVTGDHERPDPTKWEGHYTEDDFALHQQMREALESLTGYDFDFLVDHDRLIERLLHDPPDLVLNFCDTGFRNVPTHELHVPALLELLGICYTGTAPAGLVLYYDKHVVQVVAEASGVPVPRGIYLPQGRAPSDDEAFYPALIKPAQADGSVGIVPESVVRTPLDAETYLAWMRSALPGVDALWQEYLPGLEYGLALVGNPGIGFEAFPLAEVDYSALPAELPRILAFESKTGPETRYEAVRLCPAQLADATLAELRRRAELLFVRLQCRDYARFDFRTGADGEIKLLEVNPNPAWSPAAKMAVMAGFAGRSYADLLGMILDAARARIDAADGQRHGIAGTARARICTVST